MKIFYHADLDGECSAYWVRRAIEEKKITEDSYFIKFIKIDYDLTFPIDTIKKNEQVVIVDFSIPTTMMDSLLEITDNVIWIDHHLSAIKSYEEYPKMDKIKGVQKNDKKSGCYLTYQFFFGDKVPFFTEVISDFDVWTLSIPNVLEFVSATSCYNTNPMSSFFKMLEFDEGGDFKLVEKIMNEGKTTLKYAQKYGDEILKKFGFSAILEGHTVICMNAAKFNSVLFGKLIDEYDICSPFVFDGEQYNYSLYTKNPKIDVSEIAKKFKGGGHKGASGFRSKELVFKDIKIIKELEITEMEIGK